MKGLQRDSRGVSTTLGYILTISITTLLITGLIHTAGSTLEREGNRAATEELSTIGNRLVGEMLAVSRLAETGDNAVVSLEAVHSESVAGRQYYIDLKPNWPACPAKACLVLNTTDDKISVVVPFSNQTALEETRVAGGDILIKYNETSDTITLEKAQ